ncbi:MAG: metal ABC transporter ATP-binding protein [Alphaproteobacteria bacterium]
MFRLNGLLEIGGSGPSPARPDTPALSVEGLSVAYHGTPVLEGVNWQVRPGELAAIIGPNGAGKSTLIKAALGLVPAFSGEAKFFGGGLGSSRARIAYVPQRSAVDWDFPASALDVVAMGLYGRIGWFRPVRQSHRDEAMSALERMNMGEFANRQIGQLSGGQQQRVFLARALVQGADLFLMDEPLTGVDAVTEQTIAQVLRDLQAEGKTVICVHHDLETAKQYFTHALLLNRKAIYSGPVAETLSDERLAACYGAPMAA